MKKIIALLVLILFCLSVGRAWYWVTDGFCLARIEGFDGFGKEREFSDEAVAALTQRYSYLGRGRQCFAFQSEDGQYVIKLPRLDRYKSRLWFRFRQIGFLEAFIDSRREHHSDRKKKLFDSFAISFDELREDTAIIAMFNAPKNSPNVVVADRLGRVFRLPLEKTGFILQRKMSLFKDVFQEAFKKKDMGAIDKILDQLLDVVVRIASKGILSKDGSFLNNFGFDGVRAYQIDIGSFYRKEELSSNEAFTQSIHASVEKLRVWLLNLDPALLELIDRKLEPVYTERDSKF